MLAVLTSHSVYCDPFSTCTYIVSEYCYWLYSEMGQGKKTASGNISALKSSLVLHGNNLQYPFTQKVIRCFFFSPKVRAIVLYANLNLGPQGLTMQGNLFNSPQVSQKTKRTGWQGLKRWPLVIIGWENHVFPQVGLQYNSPCSYSSLPLIQKLWYRVSCCKYFRYFYISLCICLCILFCFVTARWSSEISI